MKYDTDSLRALLITALAAGANAQTTVINDPADTAALTVYYSVCPTAATTTVTLPSTITYCPGPGCNGGVVTAPPNPNDAAIGTILHVTFTGADGKVTEIEETVTVFPAPCPLGSGMCEATYTLTQACPCQSQPVGALPSGFTTTANACSVCGPNGGPTTITQTIPCTTGPYASVTPAIGSAGAYASANAAASAAAAAGGNGANAAAGAGSGAGAAAGAGNSGQGAAASTGAGADAAASAGSAAPGSAAAPGAAGANAGADSAANASAGAGANGAAPGAGMGGSGNLDTPSNGTVPAPFTGSAERATYTISALLAGVVGCLAWML